MVTTVDSITKPKKSTADLHTEALKEFREKVAHVTGNSPLPKSVETALFQYTNAVNNPGPLTVNVADTLAMSAILNFAKEDLRLRGRSTTLGVAYAAYKNSVSQQLGISV